MTTPAERFLALSPGQRRIVHELLVEHALAKWQVYVESRGEIRYRESVTGTEQTVDANLPGNALAAVQSGQRIAAVAEGYSEPIVAMQDGDLSFPESVTFAYYAIYNFFRRYAMQREEIDDWLLVNQAVSSEDDEEKQKAVLMRATERASSDRDLERLLQTFADAWNRHDVDALMSMMAEDGVFEASAGSDVNGERHEGQLAVRTAYAAVFAQYPDAHWGNARHFVKDDRGVSEWTFTGTLADGKRIEVNGCDLFTFRNGMIALKNSFRKNRPPRG